MAKQYTTRKYNGDDIYSWAVFRTADVKGMRSPIFMGQARPVAAGMDMYSARWQAKKLNEEYEASKTV
jgi:hypothetical protein